MVIRRRAAEVITRAAARAGGRPYEIRRRDALDNTHLAVLMAGLLSADSMCVDVGANKGGVLSRIVELAPRARHLAVEPLPKLAANLRERFPTVRVEEAALADHDGQSDFLHVVTQTALSGLREHNTLRGEKVERIQVRLARLDSLLDDERPAFLKIDVEGGEYAVLQGAVATIDRHRPVIAFEHGKGNADQYGTDSADVHELLTGLGLRIFDLDGNGPYGRDEFVAEFEAARRWNYIARV